MVLTIGALEILFIIIITIIIIIIINPLIGCHYFLPDPQLPSQPQSITVLSPDRTVLLDERGTSV